MKAKMNQSRAENLNNKEIHNFLISVEYYFEIPGESADIPSEEFS